VREYDGDIFWVNINRRGEIWINTREKPDPVFRIVPGKRLTMTKVAASEIATPNAPREQSGQGHSEQSAPSVNRRNRQGKPHERSDRMTAGGSRPGKQQSQAPAVRAVEQVFAPKTLLTKIRA